MEEWKRCHCHKRNTDKMAKRALSCDSEQCKGYTDVVSLLTVQYYIAPKSSTNGLILLPLLENEKC